MIRKLPLILFLLAPAGASARPVTVDDPELPQVMAMDAAGGERALRKLGKTVEMDIYPGGGHVNYEPRLEKAIMERNLAWFERWIAAGPP